MKLEKKCLRRIQRVALGGSLLSYSGIICGNIFSENLTNFQKGFIEGLSAALLVFWVVYMLWSAFNKKNPYVLIK